MPGPRSKRGLTPGREDFAAGLAAGLTQAEAYRKAFPKSTGWKPATVWRKASLLAGDGEVRARVSELAAHAAVKNDVTIERVVAKLAEIAFADARELSELRRRCCRYCWGAGYRYQRTTAEMERARLAHDREHDAGRASGEFDELGGIGFNGKAAPNPDCTECFGDGAAQPHFNDTRTLSASGAALFAGLKVTKEGIEVKTHSQTDALAQLARVCVRVPAMPSIAGPEDCVKAQAAVLAAVAAGSILPAAAQVLSSLIDAQRRAYETSELAQRLATIEGMLKMTGAPREQSS